MAGAFLTDTLRAQAQAELRGQMLQDQIAKQVARQIIGQTAQQEIGRSMQSLQGRGRAIQSAADRTSRREVGMTQLEMQKEQAEKEKTMGLITAAASAAGALGAHYAMKEPGEKSIDEILKELEPPDPLDPLGTAKFGGPAPGTPISNQARGTDAYRNEILRF